MNLCLHKVTMIESQIALKFPCYSQAKLDGVRCIVSLENDEVVAMNKKW